MLRRLGLDNAQLRLVDIYTRHHREQLLGAELVVRSGLVEAGSEGLRLYHELVNAQRGEVAATFVHRLSKVGADSLPTSLIEKAAVDAVAIPAYGQSRSISLDLDPSVDAPSLELLIERGLAMRKVRSVTASECDEAGDLLSEFIPSLTWEGEPLDQRAFDEWLIDGPAGEKMGWAMMETRMVLHGRARVGDRIQSFGALVDIADKTTQNINWVFNVESGELLTVFQGVNLAFDTVERRAMVIPDEARARDEQRCHRDLAPDANNRRAR